MNFAEPMNLISFLSGVFFSVFINIFKNYNFFAGADIVLFIFWFDVSFIFPEFSYQKNDNHESQ